MNGKRLIVCAAILLVGSSFITVLAQASVEESTPIKFKYGIGAGAGFATGYGLSFRYVPKKFGAQVNFVPYKSQDISRYSVGLTFLYMLNESRYTNFYIYQANHYYYSSEKVAVYDPNFPDNKATTTQTESYVNNGIGFGFEIIIVKKIGLNLMTGYAAYNNFQQLNITGEMALYYKF